MGSAGRPTTGPDGIKRTLDHGAGWDHEDVMVSGDGGAGAPGRRPRRAVRQAGTVGGDVANLVSVLPAVTRDVQSERPAGVQDGARPPARSGRLDRSADDTDVGWGEREAGSNDDRLAADKPPHW